MAAGGDRAMAGLAARRERVLIVEDHAMMADTLALVLSGNGLDVTVAKIAAYESISDQAFALKPELVLLDLELGLYDGLDLIRDLVWLGSAVVVVTGCSDEGRLAAALTLGAKACVSKSEPFERLLEVSEATLSKCGSLPPPDSEQIVGIGRAWLRRNRGLRACMDRLTAREIEVLYALQDGNSAQQIAD
ncbi:MAG: response regulator, partial [Acidimicrobiales bacterium]